MLETERGGRGQTKVEARRGESGTAQSSVLTEDALVDVLAARVTCIASVAAAAGELASVVSAALPTVLAGLGHTLIALVAQQT